MLFLIFFIDFDILKRVFENDIRWEDIALEYSNKDGHIMLHTNKIKIVGDAQIDETENKVIDTFENISRKNFAALFGI